MKCNIVENPDAMAKMAAQKVKEVIDREVAKKGFAIIGFSTGNTPIPMYNELVAMNQRGELSFKNVITVNLDEYVGSTEYRDYMHSNLFDRLKPEDKPMEINIPDGMAADPHAAAAAYAEVFKRLRLKGGIDLQVVGIGKNGHIGFNEPHPNLKINQSAYVVDLDEDTMEQNNTTHKQAITMGLSDIMKAKEIMMLATGPKTTEIWGKISRIPTPKTTEIQKIPAVILHLHPNTTAILDVIAASQMDRGRHGLEAGASFQIGKEAVLSR